MTIRFSMEIQIPSQEPVGPRRCGVAHFLEIHGHAFLAVPVGMVGPVEDEAGGGRWWGS